MSFCNEKIKCKFFAISQYFPLNMSPESEKKNADFPYAFLAFWKKPDVSPQVGFKRSSPPPLTLFSANFRLAAPSNSQFQRRKVKKEKRNQKKEV